MERDLGEELRVKMITTTDNNPPSLFSAAANSSSITPTAHHAAHPPTPSEPLYPSSSTMTTRTTTRTVTRRDRKAARIATDPAALPNAPSTENQPSSPYSATEILSRPKRPSHSSARVRTSARTFSKSGLRPHAAASAMRNRLSVPAGCLASCEE